MITIRTIEALQKRLNNAAYVDDKLIFENHYRILPTSDLSIMAQLLITDALHGLKLTNCKFQFTHPPFCDAVIQTRSLKILYLPLNPLNKCIDQIDRIISANTSIETLDLRGTELTDEDLLTLSGSLKKNHTLTHLQLSGNHFTEASIDILIEVLSENNTLCEIELDEFSLSREKMVFMKNLLQRNLQNSMGVVCTTMTFG